MAKRKKKTVVKKVAVVKKAAESVEPSALMGQLVPIMPDRMELIHSQSDEHERRSDIMDVVLAKAEEKMTEAMDLAAARSRLADTEVEELHQEVQKILQAAADDYAKDALSLLKGSDFADHLQFPSTITCAATVTEPVCNEKTKRWGKTNILLRFILRDRGLDKSEVITRNVSVASDKKITAKLAHMALLREASRAAYREAMGWKKKLAQIPRLTRTVRATLAEQRVRTSEEGSAALDALLASLDSNIAKLPGVG